MSSHRFVRIISNEFRYRLSKCEGYKEPKGDLCQTCWRVFLDLGWKVKFGTVVRYLASLRDAPETHRKFLKAVAKYIALQHETDGSRSRANFALHEAMTTLDAVEKSGDKAIMRRTFVEKEAYMEAVAKGTFQDPEQDKSAKLTDQFIDEEDKVVAGYWVKGSHGNGQKGYYLYEGFVEASVEKRVRQHEGGNVLHKDQIADKWDGLKSVASETRAAASKVMTFATSPTLLMADLLALAGKAGQKIKVNDGDEEDGDEDETEEPSSSDDRSECGMDEGANVHLFDRPNRAAAAAKAKNQSSSKGKIGAPGKDSNKQIKSAASQKSTASTRVPSATAASQSARVSKGPGSAGGSSAADPTDIAERTEAAKDRSANLETQVDGRLARLKAGLAEDMKAICDLEEKAYDLSFEDTDEMTARGKGKKYQDKCREVIKHANEIVAKVKAALSKVDRSQSPDKGTHLSQLLEELESSKTVAAQVIEAMKNLLNPSIAHSDLKESLKEIRLMVDESSGSPFKISRTLYLIEMESQAFLHIMFGKHDQVCSMFNTASAEVPSYMRNNANYISNAHESSLRNLDQSFVMFRLQKWRNTA